MTDTPEKINAEAKARILRLVFYVAQAVANAIPRPPQEETEHGR